MKCVICKHGRTKKGKTTFVFEREATTLVYRGVPAEVCQVCGEKYISESTTKKLLKGTRVFVRRGIEIDIRHYKAA